MFHSLRDDAAAGSSVDTQSSTGTSIHVMVAVFPVRFGS
jgi:hypothetical protein